jgi:hypothetical protein
VSAARSGLYNYGCLVDVSTACKRNAPYDSESSLDFVIACHGRLILTCLTNVLKKLPH